MHCRVNTKSGTKFESWISANQPSRNRSQVTNKMPNCWESNWSPDSLKMIPISSSRHFLCTSPYSATKEHILRPDLLDKSPLNYSWKAESTPKGNTNRPQKCSGQASTRFPIMGKFIKMTAPPGRETYKGEVVRSWRCQETRQSKPFISY